MTPFDRFYARRCGGRARGGPAARPCLGLLHRALVASVVDAPPGPPVRRASLCRDGTSVVYSQTLRRVASPEAGADGYRVLIEPGGLALTVSRQVAFTLTVVDRLLGDLGWRSAAGDLNPILRRVFPAEAEVVDRWWGGIWLAAAWEGGADGDEASAELRLYLNLRHGTAAERWDRVDQVLASPASMPADPPWAAWRERVRPLAIPVGLGLVLRCGRLAGLRVYAGVEEPTARSLLTPLSGDAVGGDRDRLAGWIDGFTAAMGGFYRQSVTMGYDFPRSAGGRWADGPTRTKIDLCCQHLPPEQDDVLVDWLRAVAEEAGLDAAPLGRFLDDLGACWTSYRPEFVSLGLRDGLDHLTLYERASGARTH